MKLISILIFTFGISALHGQQSDNIMDKTFGFQYKSPAGWVHQSAENGTHLFGHNSKPGIILTVAHDYTDRNEVKSIIEYEGIQDDNTDLQPVGSLSFLRDNGLIGTFEGQMEQTFVKATVICLFSPYGGGISIFALTSKEQFNDSYQEIANSMAKTVVFTKPTESHLVKEWKNKLNHTYLIHYHKGDSNSGQTELYLYGDGTFFFKEESHYASSETFQEYDENYTSYVKNKNAGNWNITGNVSNVFLSLTYQDGSSEEYPLQLKEGSQSQLMFQGMNFFIKPIQN